MTADEWCKLAMERLEEIDQLKRERDSYKSDAGSFGHMYVKQATLVDMLVELEQRRNGDWEESE